MCAFTRFPFFLLTRLFPPFLFSFPLSFFVYFDVAPPLFSVFVYRRPIAPTPPPHAVEKPQKSKSLVFVWASIRTRALVFVACVRQLPPVRLATCAHGRLISACACVWREGEKPPLCGRERRATLNLGRDAERQEQSEKRRVLLFGGDDRARNSNQKPV